MNCSLNIEILNLNFGLNIEILNLNYSLKTGLTHSVAGLGMGLFALSIFACVIRLDFTTSSKVLPYVSLRTLRSVLTGVAIPAAHVCALLH